MPASTFLPINFANNIEVSKLTSKLTDEFNPQPEDRFISFILETKEDDPIIAKLEKKINNLFCTKLSGFFPELLFSKVNKKILKIEKVPAKRFTYMQLLKSEELKKRISEIQLNKYKLPLSLNRLFPGSENDIKKSRKFGLHRFFRLTLPIYERQYKSRLSQISKKRYEAVLYEVSYIITNSLPLISSNPCIPFRGFKLLSSGFSTGPNPDPDWHLKNIYSPEGQIPDSIDGRGIVIGHPDSGWTPHPDLNFTDTQTNPQSPNFDLTRDRNVFNNENTAEEPLSSNARHHFHGTGTSSMIVSKENVSGIAPGARIVSIRCIAEDNLDTGVILIRDGDVAEAVWYAIQQDVDIISMSLGGYPRPHLESVVANAVYNNIIVVAAAGNIWPFVVFPALYPECIAVGASNSDDSPWSWTASGRKVAISAPGENIYCATWDDSRPNRRAIENFSSGTSFSTAITAGVASLWLQHYGKQNLLNRLNSGIPTLDDLMNRRTLQELFLLHIQNTARIPDGWDTNNNGAGILNVNRLLDTSTLPTTIPQQDWNNWARRSAMQIFYDLYQNSNPDVIRQRLTRFINTINLEVFMDRFGQESLDLLLSNPDALETLGNAINESADRAESLIEDVKEELNDFASDPIGTAAGWFT